MVAHIAFYSFLIVALFNGKASAANEETFNWQNDWDFLSSASHIGCDFRKYEKNEAHFDMGLPFVARGMIDDWQAHEGWKKSSFLKSFGSKTVRIGSESSIVYAGGTAGLRVTVQELVDQMSQNYSSKGDSPFVFDTTIMASVPAMRFDFSIPAVFSSWDNSENERDRQMWHMLSLGPSRAGLPAHNHGQTWLGLVHGMKRWFIYPPGYGPPPEVEEQFNPLLTVNDWLESVYPLMANYPKSPLDGNTPSGAQNTTGYRPLECIQMPGEVFYLPSKWTHTTLNIGETIALGGQEKSYDNIEASLAMLAKFPNNYELNKDMGLAQLNRAEIINGRFKEAYGYSERGQCLMLKESKQFYTHLADSKDTWVVLYYHHGMHTDRDPVTHESASLYQLFSVMDALSKRLHGKANVALMDMTNQTVDGVYENMPRRVDVGAGSYAFPFVKIHRGARQSLKLSTPFAVDKKGVVFDGNILDLEQLDTYFNKGFQLDSLTEGSVYAITNNALRYYQSGVQYLIKSLRVKPFHPETHIAVCNALSNMLLRAPVDQCVSNAAALFDSFDVPGVSKIALATVFQRLARIYISKNLFRQALPLTLRSLSYNPKCPTSLVDQIAIYIELNDKPKAVESLVLLKAIANDDRAAKEIPRLSIAVENMR